MSDLERLAAKTICIGFDGPHLTDDARQLLRRGVSSVVLFTRNFQSHSQLKDLTVQIKAAVEHPVLIAVDQEGGRVQRFRGDGFTAIPSMRDIGQLGDVENARAIGKLLARELREVNIDMNFSPVLDVDSNPANPVIGARSFSSDPEQVARMGCAMIEGLQSQHCAACGKHFPGHGDTAIDTHLDLPTLAHDLDRLNRIELVPFRAAIDAGVAAIMSSHIIFQPIDPHWPATLSAAVLDGLLRTQLGFDRVIVSDDMEMKAIADHFGFDDAVVRGTQAGIDLFLVCHSPALQNQAIETLVRAVETGVIERERLERSAGRLDALFRAYVLPPSD
jgi:beta-N-acetylhexosaminidase